jgi:hypothetical protein
VPELASKLGPLLPSALDGPSLLVIEPSPGYNWLVDACERPELLQKIESALRSWLGRTVEVRFVRPEVVQAPAPPRHPAEIARDDGIGDDWLIKLIVERLEAKPVRVDVDDEPTSQAI